MNGIHHNNNVEIYTLWTARIDLCAYLYFKGRNFRGFAVFSQIRESFFPRNFLKKSSSANILKKKYAFVVMISNYCDIRKISKNKNSIKKE